MIVKILSSAKNFNGVWYNMDKMKEDKGELVKAVNFGALQALTDLRPSDYINYLELQTSASKRIKNPQFHVAISTKGRDHSKEELTVIAEKWLKGMGYENQPYLLVFHKDTNNNHIHIVSTRVGRDGKKIKDSFEKLRSYEVLNQIMANDQNLAVEKAIQKALRYNFSTRAQFMMLLENQGYNLTLAEGRYQLAKFGKIQGEVDMDRVDDKIKDFHKDLDRLSQIRAIIHRYKKDFDPSIRSLPSQKSTGEHATTGYDSDLANMLKSKFGIQIQFHGKLGKLPYGYTIIDHAHKSIYKGGDLMPLSEFISAQSSSKIEKDPRLDNPIPDQILSKNDAGINEVGKKALGDLYIPETINIPSTGFQLDIRDDVDDEAIHGRNRRRKKKARTNTR